MSLNVNGYPDQGLLHDANTFARLDPLVQPLTSSLQEKSLPVPCKIAPLTGQQLAEFLYDLDTFQEQVLGYSANVSLVLGLLAVIDECTGIRGATIMYDVSC